MFDLIVNGHRNTTRRDIALLAISWALHSLVIGAVVLLPLLFATAHLPAVPEEVLTYVAVVAPLPPPPPLPPPASTPAPAVKRPSPRPAPIPRPVPQAPVVVAREIPPSIDIADDGESASDFEDVDGIADGVFRKRNRASDGHQPEGDVHIGQLRVDRLQRPDHRVLLALEPVPNRDEPSRRAGEAAAALRDRHDVQPRLHVRDHRDWHTGRLLRGRCAPRGQLRRLPHHRAPCCPG